MAKLRSTANFGVPPEIMGIGPDYAVPKAIQLAGFAPEDIGYYEINEAFARSSWRSTLDLIPCASAVGRPSEQS